MTCRRNTALCKLTYICNRNLKGCLFNGISADDFYIASALYPAVERDHCAGIPFGGLTGFKPPGDAGQLITSAVAAVDGEH